MERNISNDEIRILSTNNLQFRTDAIFYYVDSSRESDLSQLCMLIDMGIDIEVEDLHGNSLLNRARYRGGYNDTLKLLIDLGADVYKKDKSGISVYDLYERHPEFMEQLSRREKPTFNII
jgi:ankyrin repeat protein